MLIEALVPTVSGLHNDRISTLQRMKKRSVTLEAGNAMPSTIAQGIEPVIKA